MFLNIYITVSILADLLITIFGDLMNSFADIWKPMVLFAGLFFCCIIFHVLLLVISATFARKPGKIVEPVRWITIQTVDALMRLMRVKVHTTGMELIPENDRFLMVGNHRTIFDPIIGIRIFKNYRLAYVSKKENLDIPIGRNLIMSTGTIPLDRDDDRAAVRTIIQAAKMIKSGEMSMGIYPEGGTNRTEKPLLPFRNGAFKIAQRAGAPIVVITTCGTELIKKRMFLRRTDVYVDVLKVLSYDEIENISTNEIGDIAYEIMLENINRRNGEICR